MNAKLSTSVVVSLLLMQKENLVMSGNVLPAKYSAISLQININQRSEAYNIKTTYLK